MKMIAIHSELFRIIQTSTQLSFSHLAIECEKKSLTWKHSCSLSLTLVSLAGRRGLVQLDEIREE